MAKGMPDNYLQEVQPCSPQQADGRSGTTIMIWGKGAMGIRRGRAWKMATSVAVLRGALAIHGTSRVAIHGTSQVATISGIGQVWPSIFHDAFDRFSRHCWLLARCRFFTC